jgi:23S rRNA C2498 (ribose-2'-O)-methylase RlmM
MGRIKVLVGLSFVAVVVLSAGLASAAPLGEKEWKKQANAICKTMQTEISKTADEINATLGESGQPSAEQLAAFDRQFVASIRQALVSIDALAEPTTMKRSVKAFVTTTRGELAVVESDPSLLGQNIDPMPRATRAAKRLGLKVCAAG